MQGTMLNIFVNIFKYCVASQKMAHWPTASLSTFSLRERSTRSAVHRSSEKMRSRSVSTASKRHVGSEAVDRRTSIISYNHFRENINPNCSPISGLDSLVIPS